MVRALLKLILLSLLLWETKGVAGVLFKQLRENSVNIRPYMEPEGPSLTIDDVAKIPLSQFKSIEEVDASQLHHLVKNGLWGLLVIENIDNAAEVILSKTYSFKSFQVFHPPPPRRPWNIGLCLLESKSWDCCSRKWCGGSVGCY